MGTFGFKDSENILGSSKHEIRQIYCRVLSEGDGTNVKALVWSTSDSAAIYNSSQNSGGEVTSIESGDDGTYFEYPSGYDVRIDIKAAALDGTPVAVLAIDGLVYAPNNNTPYVVFALLVGGQIRVSMYDMTNSPVDIRSWAADKGFGAYITYLTAAS